MSATKCEWWGESACRQATFKNSVLDREGLKCTPRLNTADALRVRTHKLECTRCLRRVLADFSVHGVKVPARNGQTW